jgi:homoaconitate hydratase
VPRISAQDLATWESASLVSDSDAGYVARIELDLSQVTPHVAGPDSVQVVRPVKELADEGLPIQKAYLVSCVNSRLSDLQAAAAVLEGKKVADGVEMYVAAASRNIQDQAEADGTWQKLLAAGARALPPGCGPCIGLGAGLLEAGENGISATNRNFKGRMGSRDARCYLASPAVVAASAIAGEIRAPGAIGAGVPERRIETLARPTASDQTVEILDGFPASVSGRLVFVPQDNLNTDGIYPGAYTYREDMTPEKMAEVVMENYDPGFAARVKSGDVLVGGFNFGTGSSREQAATSLQYKGIPLVVAGSFSQTYLRNAFNNGVPCAVCPELVQKLKDVMKQDIEAGEKTIIAEDEVEVDFRSSRITWRGESFAFAPLSRVPQSLVVAGGVENLVRERLGIQ